MDQTSFTDSTGVLWVVREDGADESRPSTRPEGIPGSDWLRFESELEVRRLWHYPDDWRGLNALQLESLLDRASTVIARFRPAPRRDPVLGTDRRFAEDAPGSGLSARPPRAFGGPQKPAAPDRESPNRDDSGSP
jgi:hypothetical protein